jgi:hypothetical protein
MKTKLLLPFLAFALATVSSFGSVYGSNGIPDSALSKEGLKEVLIGQTRFWSNGSPIQVAVLSGEETDQLIETYSGMNSNRFKNHWKRLVFTGKGVQPKSFDSVEELAAYAAENSNVIAITATAGVGFPVQLSLGE